MTSDGTPFTCNVKTVVTKEDALQIQRHAWAQRAPKLAMAMTDAQLLSEFIVVNWAEEVP